MSSAATRPLDDFLSRLDELAKEAEESFHRVADQEQLEQSRIEFLGAKSGQFKSVQKRLGMLDKSEKPAAGKRLNEVKQSIQTAYESAKQRLAGAGDTRRADPNFDRSVPGLRRHVGRLHPITQTIEELKDIMGRLGFTVADGPEIEDDWHNFQALNIPESHPARDPLENFYLAVANTQNGGDTQNEVQPSGPWLMRSQTSTVQIRAMERSKPPIRIISLGRVYRPDTADATHYPMFHQMEGLMVDQNVNLADLKTVLQLFATSYLGNEVPIRIRPSFFPFTEPSVEADYFWNDKWVEFGGAGVVDPNVLSAVGYDPEQVSGFAFGLGVERLCMIRHQITDIRYLFTNDVRFLHQF